MQLTERKYLATYTEQTGSQIPRLIEQFDFSKNRRNLDYLTKASAVYSSNIEGNSIDLNSFMNYELNKDKFKPGKEIEEVEQLVKAYEFAQSNNLSERSLLKAHEILSKTLLIKSKRGKYRIEPVGVFGLSEMVYLAIEPEFVMEQMSLFFKGIDELLSPL